MADFQIRRAQQEDRFQIKALVQRFFDSLGEENEDLSQAVACPPIESDGIGALIEHSYLAVVAISPGKSYSFQGETILFQQRKSTKGNERQSVHRQRGRAVEGRRLARCF